MRTLLLALLLAQAPATHGAAPRPVDPGALPPAGPSAAASKGDLAGIAALIGAIGALAVNFGTFYSLIKRHGVIDKKVNAQASSTVDQAAGAAAHVTKAMLNDFAVLEASMRMVLTKEPESASIWRVISERIAHDENVMHAMLNDFAKLEAGMRMVLTKDPESESIWRVISQRIADDARVRTSITNSIFLQIPLGDKRSALKGLVEDPSAIGRLAVSEKPDEDELRRVIKLVPIFLASQVEAKPSPGARPGKLPERKLESKD